MIMMERQNKKAYPWKISVILAVLLLAARFFWDASIFLSQPNCGSRSSGPTDNPIPYGEVDDIWTNKLNWSCVYNIDDFAGTSEHQRLSRAIHRASRNGGGVVYLPAGTYQLADDLVMEEGVVIRGESSDASNAKSAEYAPPTQLNFPTYVPSFNRDGTANSTAFKQILSDSHVSNIGLIDLDINRGAITLGSDNGFEEAHNRNVIVYGVRSNNVAEPTPYVPDITYQSPWLRFASLMATNIKVTARENVLVANNRINDAVTDEFEQPSYQIREPDGNITTLDNGTKVPFSYTNHYGISVNRFKDGSIIFEPLANPKNEPRLFRNGIIIRDNWVYHTMSVGIHASGKGLLIKDNVVLDEPDKRWYTGRFGLEPPYLNDPSRSPPNITYENRAIDWSGQGVTVEGNTFEVYRHYLGDSQDQSVDGEGILAQECCGGTQVKGARLRGNRGNSYIGIWKIPNVEDVQISENELRSNVTNTPLIYVNSDTNHQAHVMNDVRVERNMVEGDILLKASLGGRNNAILANTGLTNSQIKASCHVSVRGNLGFTTAPCLESDSIDK